jgi:hypothetical protein
MRRGQRLPRWLLLLLLLPPRPKGTAEAPRGAADTVADVVAEAADKRALGRLKHGLLDLHAEFAEVNHSSGNDGVGIAGRAMAEAASALAPHPGNLAPRVDTDVVFARPETPLNVALPAQPVYPSTERPKGTLHCRQGGEIGLVKILRERSRTQPAVVGQGGNRRGVNSVGRGLRHGGRLSLNCPWAAKGSRGRHYRGACSAWLPMGRCRSHHRGVYSSCFSMRGCGSCCRDILRPSWFSGGGCGSGGSGARSFGSLVGGCRGGRRDIVSAWSLLSSSMRRGCSVIMIVGIDGF